MCKHMPQTRAVSFVHRVCSGEQTIAYSWSHGHGDVEAISLPSRAGRKGWRIVVVVRRDTKLRN